MFCPRRPLPPRQGAPLRSDKATGPAAGVQVLLTHRPRCHWGALHTSRHSGRSRWAGNIAGLGGGRKERSAPRYQGPPLTSLYNGVAPGSPHMNPEGLPCSAHAPDVRNRNRQVQQARPEQGGGVSGQGGLNSPRESSGESGEGPRAPSQTLHPDSDFTGEPGWAGAPTQPPGLSCCSSKSCEGGSAGRGGSHTWLPRPWENATAARPGAPPANKAPAGLGGRAGEESEQPIVVPGPPPGAPGLHPADLAPPPRTPNTCSLRHPQGCAPCAPRGDDAPF